MKTDKKLIFFIVVCILLLISIVYRVLNPFVHQETDQLTFTGENSIQEETKPDSSHIKPDKKQDSVIELFLGKEKVAGKVYRDLFAVYPPIKKVKKQSRNIQSKVEIPTKPDTAEDIKNVSLNTAREYLTSYQWYGTYKSQEKKAVFLAKNKLVVVAKTGDRLDGKYLIEDIQDKHLKIKALDLNETLHLDMREFSNE